uniref:Si:ch211-39f2.3 n=1 Tax=Echeneis naucrates TaxID=173247 RepID=A0A665WM47_ECHNA
MITFIIKDLTRTRVLAFLSNHHVFFSIFFWDIKIEETLKLLTSLTSRPPFYNHNNHIRHRVRASCTRTSDDGNYDDRHTCSCFCNATFYNYVNHNGHLTFDGPWSRFAPVRFPIHGNRDIIAPFWTDLDNRGNGYVLYNQYTSGSVLQQATRDINTYFPGLQFTASWVFVASWYQVAYYPTTAQAVLISGGQYSFVLMNYGPIAATNHSVQAGYDTENSTNHFTIPGSFSSQASGTNSVIRFSSNVNVTGRWAFRTDHGSRGCTFRGETRNRVISTNIVLH